MASYSRKLIDLSSQTFGKLTVLYKDKGRTSGWICQCVCGKIKSFHSQKLRLGRTKSCGCFRDAHASEAKTIHGMTHSPEYKSWCHMRERCNNPKMRDYARYGGRGISVYPPWQTDFMAFFSHIGPRPGPGYSIDRINNETGNYEPGNVKWSTSKEQNSNRRDNVIFVFHKERATLTEWGRRTGFCPETLKALLCSGWYIL